MSSKIIPAVSNQIVGDNGEIYRSIRELSRRLNVGRDIVSRCFKRDGYFKYRNVHYYLINDSDIDTVGGKNGVSVTINKEINDVVEEHQKEFEEFLKAKDVSSLPFEKYEFKPKKVKGGYRYAVALFSDAHIEETVNPNSVLGLNEYNLDIAKKRIENYFINLANCLNADEVNSLIFASLGDSISGYIHEELSQSNGLSPLEATFIAQNLIYNGLRYLCENTDLDNIQFIGIVGNHSRVTKKIQHINGYKMSYEWLMYQNLKQICEKDNLPIEFKLPESEMAIVDTSDKKRFIFIHGFQIKSSGNGTVCGIYPALNRLSMKWDKTFHQDKIYLGHFHSCISIPNATVNGSVIGYNSFALTNGFGFEEPAQMYEVYDSQIGLLVTRKIYCR